MRYKKSTEEKVHEEKDMLKKMKFIFFFFYLDKNQTNAFKNVFRKNKIILNMAVI